jgi:N-acetylglucosamine-6-phosphate deacetylase
MAHRFAMHGVTGFLASTVTQSLDLTRRTVDTIRRYMETPREGRTRILGIHLEGPFLNPEFKGMQNEAYLLAPSEDILRDLLRHGEGRITRVSLAPELPEAGALIRLLCDEGVHASIAHTAATYDQALEAAQQGATHVTHCFNAMTGLHHRRPGVVGAAMLDERLYAELIADGVHIHPAAMQILIRMKGRERVMLVTDAMSATDMPDGPYRFGGHEVTVRDGIARLADGTLASSTLTMEAAVRNVVRLCGVSLVDAVYMAATTPAEAMGLGETMGRIETGFDADLAVLSPTFEPIATWIGGQCQYDVRGGSLEMKSSEASAR